jgi:hypothetical protein
MNTSNIMGALFPIFFVLALKIGMLPNRIIDFFSSARPGSRDFWQLGTANQDRQQHQHSLTNPPLLLASGPLDRDSARAHVKHCVAFVRSAVTLATRLLWINMFAILAVFLGAGTLLTSQGLDLRSSMGKMEGSPKEKVNPSSKGAKPIVAIPFAPLARASERICEGMLVRID